MPYNGATAALMSCGLSRLDAQIEAQMAVTVCHVTLEVGSRMVPSGCEILETVIDAVGRAAAPMA